MIGNSVMFNYCRNNNLEIKTGHIVGYNIKKCYAMDVSVIDDINYKLIYGLFLHIKLDNNDQYDMVFDIFSNNDLSEIVSSSASKNIYVKINKFLKWKNVKDLIKQAKRKKKVSKEFRNNGIYHTIIEDQPPILQVMNICNADELIDLIGKEVKLSAIVDNPNSNIGRLTFSLYNVNNNINIIPILVNINTNNESINEYINNCLKKYPVMNVPEYNKFGRIL